MPRHFPFGWAPFLAAAMVAAGIATLGAVPARAQDDNIPPPPPPPGYDAAAPEDVPPPQTAPPAQPPDQQTFEQSLSPYGHWADTPEYGRVWTPDEGADWQPYTDGQWIDTDYGWTFASTVPWGWAVFHYGRWGFGPELGWFWVPGFTWAPAWVGWRSYPGFACWSPLAPRGFVFHGRWPGWVVVDRQHFTRPISRFALPRHQAGSIAHAASPVGGFASTRARRAAAARDIRSAGTASPVPKYISSGVWPQKRRMRQHAVVFVDVERHQSTDDRDAVQRVEEEPLMF